MTDTPEKSNVPPDNATQTYESLFPPADCAAAMSELSAWTSVQDIAAAARCLAGVPVADEVFDDRLVIPFADDDILERVIIEAMGWLMVSYRVPEPKIALAKLIEPRLDADRQAVIAATTFKSTVSAAPSGAIMEFAPSIAEHPSDRFMLVEDKPHVIELLQGPLRAMMGLVRRTYRTATTLRDTMKLTAPTSGAPSIVHRPYADSRLSAVVEALSFYALGFDFGPRWATKTDFEIAYRAINVCGTPPFDAATLAAARSATASMLATLK